MSEWKTYRLGDLCDSISNTYRGKAQNVVLINTSDVLEGKCLNHRKESNENLKGQFKKTFQKGDILYSEIRPSNKHFAYIDFDATDYISSTKLMVLRANEKIRPLYLYYILQSQAVIAELQMLAESRSGTFPQITFSELSLLTTSLPDIDSQDKIINILGALDDKIELNRRINANLEEQAQALFKSWFVDFEPFRDSPFVDSELGKIPQGWKVGTLSEIGAVIGGGTPSKIVSEYYTDNGIAWITPKDLSTNNCKFTSMGETDISELGYKNSSAKLMPRGSVLFSSRAPIGYISIAKNEICTNQGFKSIVPQKAGTCFIYYFLRNNTSKIESMASGSTFKEASGGLMKSLEVIIPTNKILTAFEEAIQPLFDMQEHNEDENARLSVLRNTLQPKLMAGEINVENQ